MKASKLSQTRKGFTLIELIVVIAIMAMLAGVAYPTMMSFRTTAAQSAARKQCLDIIMGISSFKSQYNGALPLRTENLESDDNNQIVITTNYGADANLLRVLTNRELDEEDMINHERDVYLKSNLAEGPRDGLHENEEGELGLFDPWGKPYYIIISDERGGAIDPYTGKATQKDCIVYSLGPDSDGFPVAQDKPKNGRKNTRMTAAQRKAALAAAAEADEDAADAIEDNVYSWKKTK